MKTEILNQITNLGLERTFLNLRMAEASLESSSAANYADERYHRESKCGSDSGSEDDQCYSNCLHQAYHDAISQLSHVCPIQNTKI